MLNGFWEELKRPFNAVSTALGLLALGSSIYFYQASKQNSEIRYAVKQIQIFDSKNAPINPSPSVQSSRPFTVLDASSNAIIDSIFAATISVWNSGDFELGRDKVRRALTVELAGTAKIIDAVLEFATDDNSAEVTLGERLNDSSLQVKWRHFDPQSGFRLRLIYVRAFESPVVVRASILGVKEVVDSSIEVQKQSTGRIAIFVSIFFLAAGVLSVIASGVLNFRKARLSRSAGTMQDVPEGLRSQIDRIKRIVGFLEAAPPLTTVLAILAVLYFAFGTAPSEPPF